MPSSCIAIHLQVFLKTSSTRRRVKLLYAVQSGRSVHLRHGLRRKRILLSLRLSPIAQPTPMTLLTRVQGLIRSSLLMGRYRHGRTCRVQEDKGKSFQDQSSIRTRTWLQMTVPH